MRIQSNAPSQARAMAVGPIGESFANAVATMLAAMATLACAMSIDAEPGPGVLAVVLCVSFSRSHLDRDLRGRLEAAVALPLVGLIVTGIGLLLHRAPWLGAAVFVAGMFVSIWLRRFGLMARRIGSLIALPFVVILTTPYIPTRHISPLLAVLVPIIVALLALFWVGVLQALARRLRLLAPISAKAIAISPASKPQSTMKPIPSTRMAIQMAVALSASFVIGYAFFAERWSWIVLTAFIVNAGNRGRLDVAYKSVLRVIGAAAGTIIALSLTVHIGAPDRNTVWWILAALFLGIALRPFGYAWWALFVTIALALLQGFSGTATDVLSLRLEEIVIGALLGVASAWLIYPVRSTDVLRRRIADSLAALSEALDPTTPVRTSEHFLAGLASVQEVAPSFKASRLATRWLKPVHPADWIDAVSACRDDAVALIERGETSGEVRKAVGAARKAIREPDALMLALQALRESLARHGR